MKMIRAFWMRLRRPSAADSSDADLNAELESHLQMHIEDNVRAGMSQSEARRQALIKLGGLEQTKIASRERRDLPWLETLGQDIRFGLRMLAKNPAFTAVAVLTLAVGVGANTAIFSVVKAVLLAPLPYQDQDRIVAVWTTNPAKGGEPLPSTAVDFAIWKQRSGVFADLAPSYDNENTLTGQGAPQFLIGYAVSANYLRILGVQPQLGRLSTNAEDRPGGRKITLLSNHLWRTTFQADPAVVGRTITLDGNPYVVVGVMPGAFNYPANVEIWTPAYLAPSAFDDFSHTYIRTLGKLKPGMTVATAQQAVNAVEAQVAIAHPDTDSGNRVVLVPLREQLDGDIRRPLMVLMGAVGLVLLIACANAAGLALDRDAERGKEIAVRLALGATRMRLLRQFATESLLLAVLGGAAGLLLALAGTHLLLSLFPNDVANLNIPKITQIPIDRGVLCFALSVTLLTAFLFGIVPVLTAARTEANEAAKESARGTTSSRRSNRSRSVIVVAEVALSLVLVTAAGLVVESFRHVVNAELGFQPNHLLALQVFLPPDRYPGDHPQKRRAFVAQVVGKLHALPGSKP